MYTLSNVDIAAARTETEAFLKSSKVDSKEILRLGLILEEVLLDYREKTGENQEFELRNSRMLGKTRVLVRLACDSFDPFENTEVAAPRRYDERLTAQYGDWRTPVRGGALHEMVLVDTQTPYREKLSRR